jgi:hypothetical protein
MTVRLTRNAYGHRRQSEGLEVDDEGRATGWQSSGQQVGRFARTLSAQERETLDRALARAQEAVSDAAPEAPPAVLPPSGVTEALVADGGVDVVLGTDAPPPGLEDLVALLLAVREDLADHPVAALALEVTGPPYAAALRHTGSEPLTVRLGPLTVKGALLDEDDVVLDRTSLRVDAGDVDGPVGPGWALRLSDDLGWGSPRTGGFLTLTVGTPEVDVRGDGVLRPTELGWMTE